MDQVVCNRLWRHPLNGHLPVVLLLPVAAADVVEGPRQRKIYSPFGRYLLSGRPLWAEFHSPLAFPLWSVFSIVVVHPHLLPCWLSGTFSLRWHKGWTWESGRKEVSGRNKGISLAVNPCWQQQRQKKTKNGMKKGVLGLNVFPIRHNNNVVSLVRKIVR